MKKVNIEGLVYELSRPMIDSLGLELVDVEYVREGSEWYLRIYIDKSGGITHDDCEEVSNAVGSKLDELDPLPQNYFLEVSSPGVERPLKKEADFSRFTGSPVVIHTFAPVEGKKLWEGVLEGLVGGAVRISLGDRTLDFPRDLISKVHLAFQPKRSG